MLDAYLGKTIDKDRERDKEGKWFICRLLAVRCHLPFSAPVCVLFCVCMGGWGVGEDWPQAARWLGVYNIRSKM